MNLPIGTVTFLFTDIEGSTRLWEQHPQAMREALARHDALAAAIIHQQRGTLVKSRGEGDSLFCVFAQATQAIAAACALQQAFASEPWPAETPLLVRMALHTGEADLRDGDYYGPAVNRCARLRAIGHGGQVLLSQATYELVHQHLPEGCVLRDRSAHRLKDLQLPEHIFQLLHPSLPTDFPPLRSLQALANNLPVQWTSFIGREKEIEEVRSLLAKTRLLTLTGSGGCGKTRLALQVAAELIEGYSDGVWLVELGALSDPAFVPQQVATALGLREAPGRTLVQTVTDYLLPKAALLLLDNCEHLIEACTPLVDTLLRTCPHLRILATSREALRITGEQIYRTPSLSTPDQASLPKEQRALAGVVSKYAAVRLFVDRAQLQRSDFVLTHQNITAVAELCSRLDGIPLAIELAAARVKMLSVEQIAARVADRFRLLTGGSRTALPRQQTLRAAMDWSYDLLSESERRLLNRLSVFAGGWRLESVEQVCGEEGVEEEVLDLLSGLVDKSLVFSEEEEGATRYRLLETVRQYSREWLGKTEEEAEFRDRHQAFFLALAEEAVPHLTGPEQGVWLERLEAEHDNLRAALEWCQTEQGRTEAGLRLAGSLWRFWWTRGYLSEGRKQLMALLSHPGGQDRTRARANALIGAGVLASTQGDNEVARTLYDESLTIFREADNPGGMALALSGLGNLAYVQGDNANARAHYEQCLAIQQEMGASYGIANSLNSLGNVACSQGDYAAAQSYLEESLAIFREVGNPGGMALALRNLGNVAFAQGDYAAAQSYQKESLAIFRELDDLRGTADSLSNLGNAAYAQGDYEVARAYGEESLAISREIGNRKNIADSLNHLGNVASAQDNFEVARALYEEGLAVAREIGSQYDIALSLSGLGGVACAQGDFAASRTYHEQSLAISQKIGNRYGIVESLEHLASLAIAEPRGNEDSSCSHIACAACLWGSAGSLREVIHAPLPPGMREAYDRDMAAARTILGEEAFATAWKVGQGMTIEQAVSYALKEEA